jgi:hypothetical protein
MMFPSKMGGGGMMGCSVILQGRFRWYYEISLPRTPFKKIIIKHNESSLLIINNNYCSTDVKGKKKII